MIAHAYIGQNSADLNDVQLLQDDGETLVTRGNDLDVFAIGGGLEYLF